MIDTNKYPLIGAAYRFGRAAVAAGIAGVAAFVLSNYAVAMDEAGLVAFTGIASAGLLAIDKFLREKGVYASE